MYIYMYVQENRRTATKKLTCSTCRKTRKKLSPANFFKSSADQRGSSRSLRTNWVLRYVFKPSRSTAKKKWTVIRWCMRLILGLSLLPLHCSARRNQENIYNCLHFLLNWLCNYIRNSLAGVYQEPFLFEHTVFVLLKAHVKLEAHLPLSRVFRAGDHWMKEINITAIFKNFFETILARAH